MAKNLNESLIENIEIKDKNDSIINSKRIDNVKIYRVVIKGRVLDSENYNPKGNYKICLEYSNFKSFTNENGEFEIKLNNLTEDDLKIFFSLPIVISMNSQSGYIYVKIDKSDLKQNGFDFIFDENLVYDYSKEDNYDDGLIAKQKKKFNLLFFNNLFKDLYYSVKKLFIKKPFNLK